ncbi:hypothetical protein WJX82_001681 [Trebouxia sp. C0006]
MLSDNSATRRHGSAPRSANGYCRGTIISSALRSSRAVQAPAAEVQKHRCPGAILTSDEAREQPVAPASISPSRPKVMEATRKPQTPLIVLQKM